MTDEVKEAMERRIARKYTDGYSGWEQEDNYAYDLADAFRFRGQP